ncbi:G-protein coupled receptor family C group 6 member A-like, partial [Pyxicephalus adspersus]|uniref:G-protein coupled receptor family C group 6 member A-like n=1 Tax=Pyxicephalus adspersus TaxID=30357 RepID=UPI003B593E0A
MRITTWNVKGLHSPNKPTKVLRHLKKLQTDVAILQETHLPASLYHPMSKGWVGEVWGAPAMGHCAGVLILIHKQLQYTVTNKSCNAAAGRWASMTVQLPANSLTLLVVYGPNSDNGPFYDNLLITLHTLLSTSLIVAGDFNAVSTTSEDRHPPPPRQGATVANDTVFDSFTSAAGLVGTWRHLHPLESTLQCFLHRSEQWLFLVCHSSFQHGVDTCSTHVSHASSAQILSDKFRFPAFLRTIPNDAYQTKAMAKLIQSSGWNWIGLITMDDDYGRSALESFGNQATNICIAFKEIIPSHLSDSTMQSRIDKAIQTILKETRVNVIVAFLKPSLIIKLFLKAMEKKIKRTWIASDSWSVSTGISSIPDIHKIGKVIGFIFKSGDTTSFQEYVNDLNQKDFEMNRFMDQYAMLVSNCSKKKYSEMYSCVTDSSKEAVVTYTRIKDKSLREDFLSDTVQPGFVFSTQLAVTAIAHAIRNLCLDRNCRNPNAFAPWELLQSLKAVNFTYKGRTLYFDSKGDASTGYDVLLWKTGPNGKINITPFAEYDTQKDVFKFSTKDKENEFKLLRKIFSRCSDECKPGQMKKTSDNKSQHTCCYECVPCPENHYTDNS